MLVRLQTRQRFLDKSFKTVPRRFQFGILRDARQVSRIDAKLEMSYQIRSELRTIWRRSSVGPLVVSPDPGTKEKDATPPLKGLSKPQRQFCNGSCACGCQNARSIGMGKRTPLPSIG
jgi:hypothetical protein